MHVACVHTSNGVYYIPTKSHYSTATWSHSILMSDVYVETYGALQHTELFSAIILDVDSKDLSSGMSSPPLTFVDQAFLTAAKSLLTKDGMCIVLYSVHIYSSTVCILYYCHRSLEL